MKRFKFAAFTLGEVLITLGIIGVVAALTMPVLLSKYRETVAMNMLKQDYSIAANALKLAELEQGDKFDFEINGKSWNQETSQRVFEKFFKPHINIVSQYSNNDCIDMIKAYSQRADSEVFTSTSPVCYALPNGSALAFSCGKGTGVEEDLLNFEFILNPSQKRKIEGKDAFTFMGFHGENQNYVGTWVNFDPSLSDEKLIEFCGQKASRLNSSGMIGLSRAGMCAALIVRHNFTVPKNYPVKF